jgi:hypothetical protein
MFVAEVRIDRTAVANTVFSGLPFENIDGGLGILGRSDKRSNE